jgi:RNA-directed DNA polymerase
VETYKNIYSEICSLENLMLAWRKARKHKTKKDYVMEFESKLNDNIQILGEELKSQNYRPKRLKTFILRDPKTRKISKSAFRDRIVHHALVRVIEPIFDKRFIYDSSANRKGKGNLFALHRFYKFMMKVSRNGKNSGWFDNSIGGYCLKADVKHYFQEIDHEILINIIKKKITDEKAIWLIRQIIANTPEASEGGGRTSFRLN